MYVYWCTTRFLYQMMFVAVNITATRRVPLVERDLFSLSEHPMSSHGFCGVGVAQSHFSVNCFVDHCLSFF
jgi:hypothetical protein